MAIFTFKPNAQCLDFCNGGAEVVNLMTLRPHREQWTISGCFSLSDLSGRNGGAEGDRTPDLSTASAALSQLSYGPVK